MISFEIDNRAPGQKKSCLKIIYDTNKHEALDHLNLRTVLGT